MVFAHIEEENETWEAFFTCSELFMCWREGEIFNISHQIPNSRFRIPKPPLMNVYFLKREYLKGE